MNIVNLDCIYLLKSKKGEYKCKLGNGNIHCKNCICSMSKNEMENVINDAYKTSEEKWED